jgi:hypothetical protein
MGKISFTMDMWSDPDRKAYMAVTAHWLERQPLQVAQTLQHRINLRVDLIGFIYVPTAHTGSCLAETFLFMLDRLQISNKVSL